MKSMHAYSKNQIFSRPLKTWAIVTLFFFCFNLVGANAVHADGLVPGSESTKMTGSGMTPDGVLGSSGEWSVEEMDSDEANQYAELLLVWSDAAIRALAEALVYIIFGVFLGATPKTRTEHALDGSKTKTTTFINSDRVKRQEFYDTNGEFVSGYEIYESGVLKWAKIPNSSVMGDNGYEVYYDDIPSGELDRNGRPVGRVAEVVRNDGTGYVNVYESPESLRVKQRRNFKTGAGSILFNRSQVDYTDYEYFGVSDLIKSEKTYSPAHRLLSGQEFYESGNLKWRKIKDGNSLEYADEKLDGLMNTTAGKIMKEFSDTGVVLSSYNYDDGSGLLKSVRNFDDSGKFTGEIFYTYWAGGSVKTKDRFDADGLLTHRDTRYESGRVESEYRQATNQTAYFSDEEMSFSNSKIYGRMTRLVHTNGETFFKFDEFNQMTEKLIYEEGKLVQAESIRPVGPFTDTPVGRTVRYMDKSGNVVKISQFDAQNQLLSTELANLSSTVPANLPVDYDTAYTESGVTFRHVVQFYAGAGTDKLKKVERYENGKLISVNEYNSDGTIKSVNAAAQSTVYQFSRVNADSSAVKLDKITYRSGEKTVDILKSSKDGTRLVVYDRWMRSVKTVFDAGSWIETQYRYDTFTSDKERDIRREENLFNGEGLMVRGLVYNSKGTQVRYIVDSDGTYIDCQTADCLQHDAGVRDLNKLSDVTGASVAIIEANDAETEHGEAVRSILSNVAGPDTRMELFKASTHWDVAAAIRSAVQKGFKVINLSLEFSMASIMDWANQTGQKLADALRDFKSVLQAAVDDARSNGVVIVAAAGNKDPELSALADLNGVVSVGATDLLGRHQASSNEGAALSLSATGLQVYAVAESIGRGNFYTGTSFATPIVAAVISKLMGFLFSQFGPDADTSLIVSALQASADDLGIEGHDATYGWGKLNAAGALEKLMGMVL